MSSYKRSLGLYTIIGSNIARARAKAGLTQEELADRIGIHRVSMANIEIGKTRFPLHRVLDIADALKISIWDLLKRGGA